MPFIFNAVELCVVTINEKPWTQARDICKAADVVRHIGGKTNYAHKWQLTGFVSETKPVDWPKDSQQYDIYINDKGMYEIVFSSQQLQAKDFKKHCCNVLFPQVRQQLTKKMKEKHQQAIEEKDATLALLTDDLQDRDNQIQAI